MKNDDEEIEPIKPNYIETELSKEQKQKCRDIVRVVKEYGLSQREIPYLVYLFSLEHENRNFYTGVGKLVGEITKCNSLVPPTEPSKKIITTEPKKIVTTEQKTKIVF
jgi:hypothetical protein